jgi:membrane-bound ClpP family serine protease
VEKPARRQPNRNRRKPQQQRSSLGASVSPTASAAKTGDVKVYLIPIYGPIEDYCIVEALEKALSEAKLKKPDVIVFHMNTPGGRVDLTDKMIKLIDSVDWATTAVWVDGPDKKALSAGAYLCLATSKIYMAPGTTIGAATPYSIGFFGAPEVNEKMVSAFRAKFRSLAQQHAQRHHRAAECPAHKTGERPETVHRRSVAKRPARAGLPGHPPDGCLRRRRHKVAGRHRPGTRKPEEMRSGRQRNRAALQGRAI